MKDECFNSCWPRGLVRIFSLIGTAPLLFISIANAYPEFMAFGYNNCMACHYNASGGGPLSDYGRAVWASEIAARPPWTTKTDEQLGEISGFIPGLNEKTPWWRPYAKYRGLYYQTEPGTAKAVGRFIQMQTDVGSTFLLDPDEKIILSGAIGYVPTPRGAAGGRAEESRNLISREYYIRYHASELLWVYLGMLDVVSGLRIPDHTAYSRMIPEVTQNDQTHSLMLYRSFEKGDLFFQAGMGNLNQQQDLREPGASLWYEHSLSEKWRLGSSLYYSENTYTLKTRYSLFSRFKIKEEGALLTEVGYVNKEPKSSADRINSIYAFGEASTKLIRGLHLISQGEYLKEKTQSNQPEKIRWNLGLLWFPLQRLEVRTQYVVTRIINPARYEDDSTAVLLQIHLSL